MKNYEEEYNERILIYMLLGYEYKQAKQIVLDIYANEFMK